MKELFERVEEAKHREKFDAVVKDMMELLAAKLGYALDHKAALQIIRVRINAEIVLPGIRDA